MYSNNNNNNNIICFKQITIIKWKLIISKINYLKI